MTVVVRVVVATLAGLAALQVFLMFSQGGIGIPGLFLIGLSATDRVDGDGLPKISANQSIVTRQPTTESGDTETTPGTNSEVTDSLEPSAVPSLEGLEVIPLQPWFPPAVKSSETEASAADKSELPWDAIEPVPFSPNTSRPAAPPAAVKLRPSLQEPILAEPEPPPVRPLASAEIAQWVKVQVTEIDGAQRGRPLHHFEFWLDAPQDVKRHLTAVAYEFNTPAVMPQYQVSSDKMSDFRIRVGGLTCADEVTVTLHFQDTKSQRVAVDGCEPLR